jgi:hypothetical protein
MSEGMLLSLVGAALGTCGLGDGEDGGGREHADQEASNDGFHDDCPARHITLFRFVHVALRFLRVFS